jgi:hypothetical protein
MKSELTYKDIPKSFVSWFKKSFDDRDKIDVFSEYDRSINVDENKENFIEKFGGLLTDEFKEAELDKQMKEEQEREKVERQEKIEKEEQELLDEWKNQKAENIDVSEFDTGKHLILLTAKKYSYATILTGEGGIGKTFLTINTIKQHTKDFIYKSGYTTPMSLYQFLYNNKDKLIILDDIEGIFKDNVALAILKGALWDTDGKRLVQYDTTSNKISAPSTFEFTGRLIVLCNKIPNENDTSVNALLSRTNHYRISFTYNQKMKLIRMILEKHKELNKEQKKEVLSILKRNTDVATENLNFRTLERLISFIKYDKDKAEELFIKTIDIDAQQKVVWDLMNSGKSVNQQIQEFYERTGKRRSTYFEIKKEIKLKLGKDKVDYIEVR